ncbi:protein-L-isoaspartate O-methyltransferase [Burkholderia ubonensis]|uniref:protein-L-isoaspartate(D-aspartate) O-methyltransferase n=1 Tax=Burkholderia ubonensis TaxID=101571 RepID=UPI00075B2751|nr:protein-L-isoaspartate(D-aspartate) O-methyltransferase [Burkholderia ubonensis]KVW41681.1 protein-L-isoaspartate O-methyltransferase [Burkholderia ubonensis]
MSGERAKRFPLALEDLKRAPRKAEGRAGERHAAGDGTRQRLSAGASARGGTVATPEPKPAAVPKPIAPKLVTPVAATRKPAAPKPPAPGPAAGKPAAPPAAPKAASKPAMQMQNAALAGAHALTSERVRERMVERLRANGVADARVLEAMAAVPRHLFVDPGLATQAYEDSALPIGHQQTISKPSVVARMIELAMAGRTLERVLEIGTGCGYQAAVLSHVARDVYSIERIKPLYERAKLNLRPLRVPNIRLHYGDGRVGLPSAAPFDAIVIAAAGLDVPQALLEQLAIGGRLVAPVGGQSGQPQVLTLVERVAPAQWRESRLDRVFFVPLKSGVI